MVSHSRVLLQQPDSCLHMLVPIHDGYGTEPPTWYRATERVVPQDTQRLCLLDGSGHKRSMPSPISGGRQHGPLLRCPSERGPTVYGQRQGLAQWAEYHYDSSNEEARP